jgi:hypothetical protein
MSHGHKLVPATLGIDKAKKCRTDYGQKNHYRELKMIGEAF